MDYSFSEVHEELSPCPMGSTHTENTTSRHIHSYIDELHGSVYSIDNLRFRLSSSPSKFQEIIDALDMYNSGTDDLTTYNQGSKIGGYRYLWQWRYDAIYEKRCKPHETTSVVIGYGLIKGNGATDTGTGFIEFNPNKLPYQGFELLHFLELYDVRHTLVKYDLAVDFPVARDKLRMIKDGRKYGCEISDSMTEYLGQRNKPGRVKVYDKAAERGYIGNLSRVELTCDGAWKFESVMNQLPVVYNYSVDMYREFKGVTLAYAIAIKHICSNGETIEPWLRLVNQKTRSKIRKAISSGFKLQYSVNAISSLVKEVQAI